MLVELAVGDAFGMPFEYTGKKINYIVGYGTHPRHPVKNGHYGDDSQMSIAVVLDQVLLFLIGKFKNLHHRSDLSPNNLTIFG
jgi:ADP-ribosylglycohydrolase